MSPSPDSPSTSALQPEASVEDRYAAGAQAVEPALCCPTSYDPTLLEALPKEVIERDYGCGDPSKHLRPGERVLDLGSGTGKICFIASQVVGPEGSVVGVDMTDEMLEVARAAQAPVAESVGYANVEFHKAHIQDLRLDRDWLDKRLADDPVRDEQQMRALDSEIERRRMETPLIPDDSIDVVVSNCVLNLVRSEHKPVLFEELYRVLGRGGRAVISDIVSDESVPLALQENEELWSGCISGALREEDFLKAFEDAGFHGVQVLERQEAPWRVVEGIEFRSLTVEAFKGKEGECLECGQSVVYKGPFKEVLDDDAHTYPRGQAVAVCHKTYNLLLNGPYAADFIFLEPESAIDPAQAAPFPCTQGVLLRSAAERKAGTQLTAGGEDCAADSGCC